ncbi:MAG: hypothetical protein HOV81_13285 [Kofleriaceae bacterium]|nr:hypothetical protein [Kofleriaceae bacterium]
MRRAPYFLAILGLAAAAGCTDDDLPPLSDAKVLTCPHPGNLPFRTDSHAFARSESRTLDSKNTRVKDEGADVLGNPGGKSADIYLADDAMAESGAFAYRGAKARTTPTGGLFSNPFIGEAVSLWHFDAASDTWEAHGRANTDEMGRFEIDASSFVVANGEPIYSILEGDGTCAEQYDLMLPPGSKVVVSDIDGTLTTDDAELIMQVADESYVPKMMTGGNTMLQAWAAKGYPIIYLTARSHQFRSESRVWLRDLEFPIGPVITSNMTNEADGYKTAWLKRMFTEFGWVPVAAYGNADTDIIAYENAGIPKDKTFIVGPLAGDSNTVAIPNMDFTQHTQTYVSAQPNNQ